LGFTGSKIVSNESGELRFRKERKRSKQKKSSKKKKDVAPHKGKKRGGKKFCAKKPEKEKKSLYEPGTENERKSGGKGRPQKADVITNQRGDSFIKKGGGALFWG